MGHSVGRQAIAEVVQRRIDLRRRSILLVHACPAQRVGGGVAAEEEAEVPQGDRHTHQVGGRGVTIAVEAGPVGREVTDAQRLVEAERGDALLGLGERCAEAREQPARHEERRLRRLTRDRRAVDLEDVGQAGSDDLEHGGSVERGVGLGHVEIGRAHV